MDFESFLRKRWAYALLMGITSALLSLFHHTRGVACGPGCFGGTNFQGLPFEWWSYGTGDVISGTEIFAGNVTSWIGLFGNFVFWFFVSLVLVLLLQETKYRLVEKNKPRTIMRISLTIVQIFFVLVIAFFLTAFSGFFSLLALQWAIFYKFYKVGKGEYKKKS